MTKFGQVSAYKQETGTATVVYKRPDACEKCGACGASKDHMRSIELKADCAVGDWVRVELPDDRFLRAAGLAYALPLGGFLAGLALGYVLSGGKDGWALAGSLAGLALCALVLKLNERRIQSKPEWAPRVTAIYHDKPDMDIIGCSGEWGR